MTRRLQAGDPAPDFTLPSTRGGQVSLREAHGQTLVLVFTRYLG